MGAQARAVGVGKGNTTAVWTPQTRRLAGQPNLGDATLRHPQPPTLCGRRAGSETPHSESPDYVSRGTGRAVHPAARPDDDLGMDCRSDGARPHTQSKQLATSAAWQGHISPLSLSCEQALGQDPGRERRAGCEGRAE
jgi:hypothetical protein